MAGPPPGPAINVQPCGRMRAVGAGSVVASGPLAGRSLHQVVVDHPEALMGTGWSGQHFVVLTKFIDGAGSLPVPLHADDETAKHLEAQHNGTTEAGPILDAAPGATALCGVKDGVTADRLRAALEAQDFDAVLRRLPVRSGDRGVDEGKRRRWNGGTPTGSSP
ncbi:hypothetical protein AB0N17_01130 [Streptomyces sp. NPDC051133]|uniref:hypothetical protein n=1 Tax=Streptomyces sp. NPDC051133 TaxID=3155521 RepID=UPI00342B08AB